MQIAKFLELWKGSLFSATDRKHVILFTKSNQCFSPPVWVFIPHTGELRASCGVAMFSKELFWGILLCWKLFTSETPQNLFPLDTETDLANRAPRREKFAVTFADNWIKQIAYFHDKLSGVLLACYPALHSQQTGHREWGQGVPESHNRRVGRQHKSAALSLILPGHRIFPDTGLSLLYRKKDTSNQYSPSASMSSDNCKDRFQGNYVCSDWFYLVELLATTFCYFFLAQLERLREILLTSFWTSCIAGSSAPPSATSPSGPLLSLSLSGTRPRHPVLISRHQEQIH